MSPSLWLWGRKWVEGVDFPLITNSIISHQSVFFFSCPLGGGWIVCVCVYREIILIVLPLPCYHGHRFECTHTRIVLKWENIFPKLSFLPCFANCTKGTNNENFILFFALSYMKELSWKQVVSVSIFFVFENYRESRKLIFFGRV